MKVSFELPDRGEAAKRLKQAAEENGIPVSATASLLLQSAVTGRASGLLRPWAERKKKAKGTKSGDKDAGSDDDSDPPPVDDVDSGPLPMSKGNLKWMNAGRGDDCKGEGCDETIMEGDPILWDSGNRKGYKAGCRCGTAERLAREGGLRVPGGLTPLRG